jgi:Zn finger protein HypA/HybF involved in hydrogenase expression
MVKMKCKKCKANLNSAQTKETNPKSLCGFCDGTIFQMVKAGELPLPTMEVA